MQVAGEAVPLWRVDVLDDDDDERLPLPVALGGMSEL